MEIVHILLKNFYWNYVVIILWNNKEIFFSLQHSFQFLYPYTFSICQPSFSFIFLCYSFYDFLDLSFSLSHPVVLSTLISIACFSVLCEFLYTCPSNFNCFFSIVYVVGVFNLTSLILSFFILSLLSFPMFLKRYFISREVTLLLNLFNRIKLSVSYSNTGFIIELHIISNSVL